MNFRNWLQISEDKQVQRLAEALRVEMRDVDNELLQAVKSGDQTALGKLLSDWTPRLQRYLQRKGVSPNDVEDVVQNAMVNILSSFEKGNFPDNFDSWAYTIARHAMISNFRARSLPTTDDPEGLAALQGATRSGTVGAVLDTPPTTPDPFDLLTSKEDDECVARALDQLAQRGPKGERDVQMIRDFYWRDKSIAEIADDYGEKVGTVKRILHVARRRLGKCLEGETD